MTNDELLDDLSARISAGVSALSTLREDVTDSKENTRLMSKINGMLTVQDWLRSYRTPSTRENVDSP